ncbi:hypothetical protein [Nonomuraea sp. NPDC003214]
MPHDMPATAFWIEAGFAHGEPLQELYGERLAAWRTAFAATGDEPEAGGVGLDPVHYALAAWELATGPVADPPYVRRHPRVLDATCHRPEGTALLLAVVELAAPQQVELPGGWQDWQPPGTTTGGSTGGSTGSSTGGSMAADQSFAVPPYDRKAALWSLELRLPLDTGRLPVPTRPRAGGLPNLGDAQAALEALIAELNAHVWPVIAALES